jgi:hypothetical protein
MVEYTALDSAQLYSILKNYGNVPDKTRKQMMHRLCQQQYAWRIKHGDGRTYFIRRRSLEIKGRLREQVMCFWVLLAYLDRVDRHFASGTASSLISMEINGRDYSILYAEPGKEKMCSYSMAKGGVTRYFVVVEDAAQIPLIQGNKIHAFVTVSEQRQIQFYTVSKGD